MVPSRKPVLALVQAMALRRSTLELQAWASGMAVELTFQIRMR